MSEVWIYAVPAITFGVSVLNYLVAEFIWHAVNDADYKSFAILPVLLLLGTGVFLSLNSLTQVHLISQNPTSPDLTKLTSSAYIVELGLANTLLIYLIVVFIIAGMKWLSNLRSQRWKT
jgi:hypothetical protein